MSLVQLSIPRPCAESWAAMTPTARGRHCAACQKTVVDFTHMTDAEILAHLSHAGRGEICGRVRAGQLARPLQPLALARPLSWRAWLATLAAVWGLREGAGASTARAQAPTEQWATDSNALEQLQIAHKDNYEGVRSTAFVLRGVVLDAESQGGLPGASIIIKNSQVGVATDASGRFALEIPAAQLRHDTVTLLFKSVGFLTQERTVLIKNLLQHQQSELLLMLEVSRMGGLRVSGLPPAPWQPRQFYYWSKYWLNRPFRSH
ncbi:carboxypeptidase-like regulatory domain-containing protein [Hymenobacter sp. ASUV-10]|uniref:Carboxypeptidase-like regulatory domain-containing protein n=1 Tax=Hymenobacter aranciens TaxID=3063996 RepID=A0ABT9B9K1_9BACT|nr:carboxypeptidase-like regulatory domain-containing protein [Hymenobacter sp. ASUV-10]MDO7874847.1 carboxypeptidase-like regulatory domain-containing protein [Hymenobacter sp. ASUV-10]